MDTKVAADERYKFSERLRASLIAAGLSVKAGDFVRAFNARADGAAVSVHAVRKWLSGEAIPTHEKIVILSLWLGVNAAWLQFGEADSDEFTEDVIPESSISTPTLALVNDILSLPQDAQQMIRGIVDVFLLKYRKGSGTPGVCQEVLEAVPMAGPTCDEK